MKRIVIDARESGTTTGRYLDKLVEYLYQLKPKYDVVLLAKNDRIDFYKQLAPGFSVIETNFKEFTFGEQLGFRKQIQSLKADLVFFPMVQQPVWYRGTVVTTMNDLTTVRFRNPSKNWLVFTVKQRVYRWVNRVVARKSKAIITFTKYVRDDVAEYAHIDHDKITVTYLAADKITTAPEEVVQVLGKRFLLSVGRPAANKNLNRLVDAFNLLAADQPDLHLVLAGKFSSEYEKLQQYAHNTAHGDRIIFTDFVSEGQLRWLYEHAAAYVFPSLSEGFGLPGLEAMQYNLPVVSSNATCLPEVYKDAAAYFDPYSVDDMAQTINKILGDKKFSKELAQKGTQLVKTYSWKRMAEQTLAVFEKTLR